MVTVRGRALVFGDDTRSFLAILRSLGRKRIAVHAAPTNFRSPALASRYLSAVHRIPPYFGDGTAWCAALTGLLRRESFDLVIPCDERSILPIALYRQSFADLSRMALPDRHALEVFFDKAKTRDLAASCAVPVAPGRRIVAGDSGPGLVAEFGLPLVLKPCRSFRLEALYSRAGVAICLDEKEVTQALADIANVPTLAEGHFAGAGAGVSILASRGRVLQAFQHRRARERGGAGFYRVSEPLAPDLTAAVERMAAATAFTGVAMFEFKVASPSGRWILLEVNARPWGSMPLPVALGVDFPFRWYQLLVEGEETPSVEYRAGVYGRNLIPDAHQILAEARELRSTPLAMIRYLGMAGSEYGRILTGREHLDVLVSDDPAPGLVELRHQAKAALSHLLRWLPGGRRLAGRRDRRLVRRIMAGYGNGRATLVMLCQGNICRSPVAAELLRRRLGAHVPDLIVVSAGMLPREGACSPQAAVEAARRHDIDLAGHRSAYLSDQCAGEAALLVVFDRRNMEDLRTRSPELVRKTVMLGSFLDRNGARCAIPDPDGGDLATFEWTYAAVAAAVKGLAAAIDESGPA
ncbi:MAG: hypothetical protein ACREFP_02480 [Acetobacteraceae bacterium]